LRNDKEDMEMGVGVSLVLIAVGAILRFATTASVTGFNIQTVGLILLIVGGVGLVLGLVFWGSWGGYGVSRRRTVTSTGYGDPYANGSYGAGGPGNVVTRVDDEELV
jgi:hypothetical protein